MSTDETVVTVAQAIDDARPKPDGYPNPEGNEVVDHVAVSIADALFPHDTLTQNCSRRLFLTTAGVVVDRLLCPRKVSRSLMEEIKHACGPKSGCADAEFPPG
jgi:hypothetical protein